MKTKERILKCAAAILVGFILAPTARATPVQWNGNGHYYDFIQEADVNWFSATGSAAGMTFSGVFGHLATITSAGENDFLTSTFHVAGAPQYAWIGGELFSGGAWLWKTGPPPEFNTQFSSFGTPTPPYNYANWGAGQPDGTVPLLVTAAFNVGDTSLGIAPGQWADFDNSSPTPAVIGYFVEFEVPEPSGVTLFGVGSLIAIFLNRKCVRRLAFAGSRPEKHVIKT